MATVDRTQRLAPTHMDSWKIHHDLFTRVAGWTIRATGGRWGFLSALAVVVIWAVVGPFCHYSENWQLVINTGTTIVTFLMVFLIQNAQNRESKAVHLKLDELILAVKQARNEMIDVENLSEEQLDRLGERYSKVAERHHHKLASCFEAAEAAPRTCNQVKQAAGDVRQVHKKVEEIHEEVEELRQGVRETHMTVK